MQITAKRENRKEGSEMVFKSVSSVIFLLLLNLMGNKVHYNQKGLFMVEMVMNYSEYKWPTFSLEKSKGTALL